MVSKRGAFFLFLAVGVLSQFTPLTVPVDSVVEPTGTTTAELQTFEGKRADPCARFTVNTLAEGTDCATLPDSSVTVLIPSETSPATGAVLAWRNAAPNPRPLTIDGLRLNLLPAATTFLAAGSSTTGCNTAIPIGDTVQPFAITATAIQFSAPTAWLTVARELESRPRPLCLSIVGNNGPWVYTGFKLGTVWNCQIVSGVSTCPGLPPAGNIFFGYQSLTMEKVQERARRLTCCKGAGSTTGQAEGTGLPGSLLNIGQCIFGPSENALAPQTCCGNAAVEIASETCCNAAASRTSYSVSPCSCSQRDTTCPTGSTCCLPTKYSEFITRTNPADSVTINAVPNLGGQCVGTNHRCCDTGMRYDPGVQQCCPINGVQSLNVPCPCGGDAHCPDNLRCCSQVNSTIMEVTSQCNAYANYPSGTGPYEAQRCGGACFDPTYQICCNGVQCIQAYEKCCNSTCCNRFTQTCSIARMAGTPGNRYNFNEFNVKYEACSTVENLTPLKIYFPIVLPIFCLIMSLVSTALCLVFANKASSRSYAAIEKTMIYIAVICNIFDIILYFSPAWKYGLFILFVQDFVIISSAARVKWLNIWSLVFSVMLAIYLVDPFHGNTYLTLASSRTTEYFPERDSAGLIHVIGHMFKNYNAGPDFCITYYLSYFGRDPNLRDYDRYDNPAIRTYGYCDRAYILNLLVFCALIYVCALLQLLLNLLALLLRFNKTPTKLVSHEE